MATTTREQRIDALEKANRIRFGVAELKAVLATEESHENLMPGLAAIEQGNQRLGIQQEFTGHCPGTPE